MIARNCAGKVPDPGQGAGIEELAVYGSLVSARGMLARVRDAMERQAFHGALEAIWQVVREANRLVDADAPWALRESDPERMAGVLYVLAEVIRHLAIILWPFMPDSCDKLLDQLAVPKEARNFAALRPGAQVSGGDSLTPGTPLPKPEGVFPRFTDEGEEGARA